MPVIGLAIKMPRDFTNQYVSPFPNLLNLGLQFVVDVIYIYISVVRSPNKLGYGVPIIPILSNSTIYIQSKLDGYNLS